MITDVCKLIKQIPSVNDIGDVIMAETEREVFCKVLSIGLKRKVEALTAGLKLSFKIILSDYAEYEEEEILEYKGIRYNVVSTYIAEDNSIELMLAVH